MPVYKLVRVDQETIPGADVAFVLSPDPGYPFWVIKLNNGIEFKTTHPVTVIEDIEKEPKE